MICLGIDPDTKSTGIAVVVARRETLMRANYEVVFAGVATAKGQLVQDRLVEMAESISDTLDKASRFDHAELCVVEWQRLRPNREKNPNSILDLTGIAGMAVSACQTTFGGTDILTPIPSDWKGQVAKRIHHKRILEKVTFDKSCGFTKINLGRRTHVIDAIGLAMWGHEQMLMRKAPG